MKQTPLYSVYADLDGVRLVDFGGWELPIQFSQGIIAEHHAVRTYAGLFDVSHMGEFLFTGPHAEAYLQYLLTSDISQLKNGQAKYGLLCYPDGGVVDDVLVYRFAEDLFWLVVNAGNREKDFRWVTKESPWVVEGRSMPKIEDISDDIVQIAFQGPMAVNLLTSLGGDLAQIQELNSFEFLRDIEIDGVQAVVSRTGYTGEDGVEVYFSLSRNAGVINPAAKVWNFLLSLGADSGQSVMPCGLGCRDTLRLESKMPLYGHEISADISPLEANLSWAVALEKDEFCGRDALVVQKEQGAPRSLRGVIMVDKAVPREGNAVYRGETPIGVVTSGAKSPTGEYFCALVLIQRGLSLKIGDEVTIDIRGKKRVATLVKTPFYKRNS